MKIIPRLILPFFITALLLCAIGRGQNAPVASPLTLDLASGTICGATIGMDEAAARKTLIANHFPDINKIDYPNHFPLQATPGIVFNFRGKHELNDIYTNSPAVVLSNGLKLGQSMDAFTALLGEPSAPKRLPSGVGVELVYKVGPFELAVICLDKTPSTVSALTLRIPGAH